MPSSSCLLLIIHAALHISSVVLMMMKWTEDSTGGSAFPSLRRPSPISTGLLHTIARLNVNSKNIIRKRKCNRLCVPTVATRDAFFKASARFDKPPRSTTYQYTIRWFSLKAIGSGFPRWRKQWLHGMATVWDTELKIIVDTDTAAHPDKKKVTATHL